MANQEAEALVKKRRALLSYFGTDEYPDGTVLRLFKCFGNPETEKVYTYVAIKLENHQWFLEGKYMGWSEILLFLDKENSLDWEGILQFVEEGDWHDHNPVNQ